MRVISSRTTARISGLCDRSVKVENAMRRSSAQRAATPMSMLISAPTQGRVASPSTITSLMKGEKRSRVSMNCGG